MASDREELNRRRQQRAEARKRRQRRLRMQLLAAVGVLVLAVGLIWWFSSKDPQPAPGESVSANTAGTTQSTQGETVIHVVAAGDVNVTDQVVAAGEKDGYLQALSDAAPALANGDLTLVNFEGNLFGAPYGTASASAPQTLIQALADIGVDVVQTANSYTIHNGLLGLSATLEGIRSAGMAPVGAVAPDTSGDGYLIREIDGIRVAVIAFTKGMNSQGLPAGSEGCVNLLYEDYATTYQDVDTSGITKLLREVNEEQPDFTIAMVHWGSEYSEEISSSQKRIRDLMLENGVDAIIGTHSHLVQKIEFDQEAGTLVAYSLGDFFGDGEKPASNYSIALDLEITRDNATGETRLTGYDYTPLYLMRPEESGADGLQVVRLDGVLEAYREEYLDRVSQEVYEDMTYAYQRIQERIAGEE